MPDDGQEFSAAALDDIAYLSRSAYRVTILDILTDGSFSRQEVADRTGASRTTIDRIVNELEERGWAERTTAGTYEATTKGIQLMRQFRPFTESVEALHRLDDAITWLPIDEMSIGLDHFSDAVVRQPEADDPVEAVEFMTELLEETSEFRVLADLVPPQPFEQTLHDRVVMGELSMDGVTTTDVLGYVAARPDRFDRWRTLIEAGSDIAWIEGPPPCNLWIFDDTVLIKRSGPGPIDESYGVPIVSEDETVRSWAHGLIDEWLNEATLIDVAAFDDDMPVSSG